MGDRRYLTPVEVGPCRTLQPQFTQIVIDVPRPRDNFVLGYGIIAFREAPRKTVDAYIGTEYVLPGPFDPDGELKG